MKARGGDLARDVYRDLRDRRLISIAIVLVLAIIAVPFLIKSDPDPGAPPVTSFNDALEDDAELLNPAVVSAPSELRDYRRRLDSFQRQNPFEQQMTTPVGGTLGTNTEPTSASGGLGSASVSGGSSSSSSSVTDTSTIDTVDPSDAIDPVDPVEPVEEVPPPAPESVLYTTSVDVRVGPVGKTKIERKVRPLDYLPSKSTPVVQHTYADFGGESAAFVVSPSVVDAEGDGRCEPTPQDCQFLLLDLGEEQRLTYDDGVVYRLELLEVNLHDEVIDGDVADVKKDSPRSGRFSTGLEGSRLPD